MAKQGLKKIDLRVDNLNDVAPSRRAVLHNRHRTLKHVPERKKTRNFELPIAFLRCHCPCQIPASKPLKQCRHGDNRHVIHIKILVAKVE